MCGLFGHTISGLPREVATDALSLLAHRGPDQAGEWQDDRVYLGHRRLSILDLSENGRQPMVSPDGRVAITVNGEIYNYQKLKSELEGEFRFRSSSDSEVVLHGYARWGIEGLLKRIEGMFSICIYDAICRKIFLVRDRPGIKPMFYSVSHRGLVWSSELKSIVRIAGFVDLEFDPTAMYDFLTYGYVPGHKTIYKHIHQLEPANYLEYDLAENRLLLRRYWNLSAVARGIDVGEAVERTRELLGESVGNHLMSDVPIGFFLSGGIDSSVIVAESRKKLDSMESFTIGFSDRRHDETLFASQVAKRYATNHHEKIFEKTFLEDPFQFILKWYDEPFGDTSAFPTFLVSQFAKSKATVILTGDGGDEIFGGYRWYEECREAFASRRIFSGGLRPMVSWVKNRYWGKAFGKVAGRFEKRLLYDDLEIFAKIRGGLIKNEKRRQAEVWGIPTDYDDYWFFRKHYRSDLPLMTRLQFLDFHTFLPDDVLTKVDRASMAVSIETRVPFLATKVIEFGFSLPEEVRYFGGQLKGIIKKAYKDDLPDEILYRPKRGFGAPSENLRRARISGEYYNHEIILRRTMELLGMQGGVSREGGVDTKGLKVENSLHR